jgi:hypothetical protein
LQAYLYSFLIDSQNSKVAFVAGSELVKKLSIAFNFLASVIQDLAYLPVKADPDMWIRDCKTH